MSAQRFTDEVEIELAAGRGGGGSIHFARYKYQPKGGPDGGDGGKGGDVILAGDSSYEGLEHLASRKSWKAENGGHGSGAKKQGANAPPLVLPVPLGTILYDCRTKFKLAEITMHGMEHVAARGGRGGRGNVHFATPKNKAPRRADEGEPGETRLLSLTYRVFSHIALMEDPAAPLQLLQGLMGKRTSSPHRFHQRPRRIQCEYAYHKLDVAFLPLTVRDIPRFQYVEHLHFAKRLLVNTLWIEDIDEVYPQLMRELSKYPLASLEEIWLLCREDAGFPYQVDFGSRELKIKNAIPPAEVASAEMLWGWAQSGLQEFFLPKAKKA